MHTEEIRFKVKELENENNHDKIIQILQEINKSLLTEYILKIDGLIIEPLRVEAYYFHENKFEDYNVHRSPKQKGKHRFGKLYLHENGRGGVDICLSDGDYYLSFLIKNSRIDQKVQFSKQVYLNQYLLRMDNNIYEKNVLYKKKKEDRVVFHTIRKGLTNKSFHDKYLASLIELDNRNNKFDFEKGYGKERIVCDNIKSHNPEDYKEYLGYNISKSRINKLLEN